jgi:hypothetical protein
MLRFMAGNPNAVGDLTALPESLTGLYVESLVSAPMKKWCCISRIVLPFSLRDLSDNALEAVPKGVADLSLDTMYALEGGKEPLGSAELTVVYAPDLST